MTQQLTALLPFPGAQSQVPVPVLGSSQSVTTVPGDSAPSSGLCGALHICAHRHTQIHIYKVESYRRGHFTLTSGVSTHVCIHVHVHLHAQAYIKNTHTKQVHVAFTLVN